jgi:hypothetical protein
MLVNGYFLLIFIISGLLTSTIGIIEQPLKQLKWFLKQNQTSLVTLTFQECLGKSVLLLPMGRADDGAHSINEKLDLFNYIQGIKLLSTYLVCVGNVKE